MFKNYKLTTAHCVRLAVIVAALVFLFAHSAW